MLIVAAIAVGFMLLAFRKDEPSEIGMSVLGYSRGIAFQLEVIAIDKDGKLYLSRPAASAFRRMMAAWGKPYTVNSAFRTNEHQAALYAGYLAGGNLAAAPGFSTHQSGLSVDIAVAAHPELLAWLRIHARAFGFVNDVSSEPWHWTYKGVTQ